MALNMYNVEQIFKLSARLEVQIFEKYIVILCFVPHATRHFSSLLLSLSAAEITFHSLNPSFLSHTAFFL